MAGEDQLPAPAQAKDGEEGACGVQHLFVDALMVAVVTSVR